MSNYTMTTVFRGSRWGAKRRLVNMGLDPWMADAVLSSAKIFSTYVHPWKVQGWALGVGCKPEYGLLFSYYTYIVMVGR